MAERLSIRDLGEYYRDMLTLEAWLKGGRSLGDEACNLLCARLMGRKDIRAEMLRHLARKRRIEPGELVESILLGNAEPITQDEHREIVASENEL
jgi:hypothetical protein